MLSTQSLMIRAKVSCTRIQPSSLSLVAIATRQPHLYSHKAASRGSFSQNSSSSLQRQYSTSIPLVQFRNASTSTPEDPTHVNAPTLNWNEFLRLRRIRRYFNIGASVGTSMTSLGVGMGILGTQNIQSLSQTMFGLDPFVVMGLWAAGFMVLGWLLGPLVGTGMFGLFYRRFRVQMVEKEKDFFSRIKRYRVDPTSSSMQNPVPDYYGEKITSVAGYRQWLKDQRAFNKKRQSFV